MSNEEDDEEEEEEEIGRNDRERLKFQLNPLPRIQKWSSSIKMRCVEWFEVRILRKRPPQERTVPLTGKDEAGDPKFTPNIIANQKYRVVTFLPKVLYEQFKFFLNLYFLVVSLTQVVPQLRINQWYTYWGPLGFVLSVTMIREAFDDLKRRWRDRETNSQMYSKLTSTGFVSVKSSEVVVGNILCIEKNQRIPADVILLRTSEKNGTCFIRTDQLDGETDWKLRVPVPQTQELGKHQDILDMEASVCAEKPQKEIYSFFGSFSGTLPSGDRFECPLGIENTMWGNTVLASGTALCGVVYTGRETRSVLNTSQPRAKVGLLDLEINRLTKVLFCLTLGISFAVLCLRGFSGPWYLFLLRYILLFSYIIPISLRVSLEMGKLAYSWHIQRDPCIPETAVRCSTIPEELGRVEYFLTDKTGTLTRNEMVFKKLAMGVRSFGSDSANEVARMLSNAFKQRRRLDVTENHADMDTNSVLEEQVYNAVLALAVCHNVTPVLEEESPSNSTSAPNQNNLNRYSNSSKEAEDGGDGDDDDDEVVVFSREDGPCDDGRDTGKISYQASSPDEVALVTWTERVGLTLTRRELTEMDLEGPHQVSLNYKILQLFPFTSETKRMGIVVQDNDSGRITLYMKGADSVMSKIVSYTDWLDEECGNLAREGLRILVVGKRDLSVEEYRDFETRYTQAKLSIQERNEKISSVLSTLEKDLQLLCVTGVEDQLQEDVRPSLEMLRNAGIKVWMLTGDKLETAISIALSAQLVSRHQGMYIFNQVTSAGEVRREIGSFRRKTDHALVISGSVLEVCLSHYESEFLDVVKHCPAVVCCRCSPTHKAQVVLLIKKYTKRPTCAIGDGGNDVSMIQAANVGIGIVGKEGKQASLAADFSITKFKHVSRLLLWHGRNSYKRSSALSQFVIHRGLIITAMQVVFTVVFYFAAVALYEGVLMIGYATVYTMTPIFSLVLDEDVTPEDALDFPELYRELTKGRALSFKTFFTWFLISVYQGAVIMFGSFLLLHDEFLHVVAVTFTALIVTELVMVGLTVRTWHWLMVVAEAISVAVYIISLAVLSYYFDPNFLLTFTFVWKTALITGLSIVPLCVLKIVQRRCAPSSYLKLARKNSAFRNCAFWRCKI